MKQETQTIWSLTKESVIALPYLMKRLWSLVLLVFVIDCFPEYSGIPELGMLSSVASFALEFCIYVYAIALFKNYHDEKGGNSVSPPPPGTELTLMAFFLTLRVYTVTAIASLLIVFGLLFFYIDISFGFFVSFIFALPALLYFINRSLGVYALIFEKRTINEALLESKRLMTAEKWYSLTGPVARLSLVVLPPSLIYGVASAIYSDEAGDMLFRLLDMNRDISLVFLG